MYVCTYVCLYVCMYVCMYVCRYVCMYVRMYVCTYVCMYVGTYVCIYVCMYVYMYVHIYVCIYARMYKDCTEINEEPQNSRHLKDDLKQVYIDHPQIFGATAQNLVFWETWLADLCTPVLNIPVFITKIKVVVCVSPSSSVHDCQCFE
jgi:hypothetical protein